MANVLTGLSSSNLYMYSCRPDMQWLDCGSVVNTLERRLGEAFKKLPKKDRKMAHEVCVVGWRWRRNRKSIRPFVSELIKPRGEFQKFKKTYAQRFWNWKKTCQWVFNPDRIEGFRNKLRKTIVESGGLDSPEKFEQGIVKFIRHLSQADERVGKACMVIRINPWAAQEVLVRYEAPQTANKIARMNDSFTPIVIAPPSVWGASEATGGQWSHEELVGGKQAFRWIFQGVDLKKKPKQGFRGTQSRPKNPQAR
ncbi:hypothetical protein [Marinobacter sp. ATCH36]|uniref:hypothetical protein n=1 Tax=Marinobacter sp. ATCH36 TaxID=2945106 RepID=UPI002021DE30|nr:hypothetical protein [Marinobacter sp. ATCH36]MCL7945462.1 hypothetical protein [Marinobacter sp. ATCH36]